MASTGDVSESNRSVVGRFTEECWNTGNVDAVSDLVASNCRYHDPVFPHMANGVESMRRHIERCRRAFPDLRFTITSMHSDRDDEVEVHWAATARQAAEFLGMPATERRASITGTSIYRIEGGKIVENWVTWDLMSLMEQLGAALKQAVVRKSDAATGPR